MRRFVTILLVAAATAVTAVAGFAFAGAVSPQTTAAVQATTVMVDAFEFGFTFSQSSGPAGEYTFVVKNNGTVEHDFAIGGKVTPTIAPGATATLTVTLDAGLKSYVCTIGEHATFGMEGTFNVTGPTVTTTQVTTITTGGTTQVITTTQTQTVPTTPAKPSTIVRVTENEFKIILPTVAKRVTVRGKLRTIRVQKPIKAGLVRFIVKNTGKLPHDFVIGSNRTLSIRSGQTRTLDARLKKGKHKYICSIQGHAALGMKGTLVVS